MPMILDSPIKVIGVIFLIVLFMMLLSLVLIFIMHILMPRKVLETYFKEPYFSATEITMFTGFPFGYIRTSMFMRVLGFPANGKRRGIENAYQLAPVWYCKASKYLTIFIIIIFSLLLPVGGIVYVYSLLHE